MPVSIINKPFRAVATLLAYVAKVSSFHPIHTLIVTCLFASIAYLSIVDQYFSLSSSTAEVVSTSSVSSSTQLSYSPSDLSYYYISPRTKEWVKVSDLTKITSEIEHYNVFPYQFGRSEDVTFPALENALSDSSDSSVKFVITKDFQDEPVQSALIAKDGTVWEYKTYHTKLSKYTESVMNVYHKLVSLLQGAETFDIAIIALAYAGMGYTFISLFLDMRKIGSKFWLGFATLVTSFFAFLFGLYTATRFLNIDVPVLSLTEGVPFLVATIGFKHKILLTQKVLHKYSSKEYLKNGSSGVLFYGIKDQGTYLVRDYALIITAFVGCSIYASYLENLRNFCLLGALMVAFDLIVTTVFYSAILALKLEINLISRAIVLKQTLQEDGLTESTIDEVIRSNSLTKDNALPDNGDGAVLTTFKIVALSGFFAFHAFGLGSAWLSDIEVAGSVASLLDKSILSQIPVGGKGTLVTLFPTKFFLPVKTSIQIEDFILSAFGYVSGAIRDRYISKFVLFLFTVSVSINIYLLNAARIHSKAVEKDVIEFKKPKKIRSEPVVSSTSLVSLAASSDSEPEHDIRPFDQLVEIATNGDIKSLFNDEVALLAAKGKVPLYALEKKLGDNTRAVAVRRQAIAIIADVPHLNTHKLPYLNYDYDRVFGACCENVIGYMPLPVGVAGPLIIDGKPYHIPMATTEGCLVASAMRGCKAINLGGGTTTVLTKDGMTRGPVVSFPSLKRAGACKIWVDSEEGQATIKKAFNSTSRFARLQHIQTALAGDLLFLRFRTTTGDAMGMNMISKGVEFALNQMVTEFGWDDMSIISVSGNYCTDKKPAAINWIEGRGKSIVAEAIIPKSAVEKVLKTTVKLLVKVNINKNLIGSAMAGSVGGFNAQAANLLTAIYLACGQDPAQNVESSNCITLLDETEDGDLKISVSMPSIEVGTIGGGTILDPQGSMLELLGVKGPATVPGDNARQFAKIVASLVLAGELSLLSALAAGHLVQSHMQHNRAGAGKK